MLQLSRFDRVDPVGRAEVFIWRKVGSIRRVVPPLQRGDPPRQVTLVIEPIDSQVFVSQVNGSLRYEKLTRPG